MYIYALAQITTCVDMNHRHTESHLTETGRSAVT